VSDEAFWSPDDWQDYCIHLLTIRHGEKFQRVPDRRLGDRGIEGYAYPGVVYQCYAPQPPYTSEDLLKRQKEKVTTDLRKLVRNIEEISSWTAPEPVNRWVFMVPEFNTWQLLDHTTKKATEVRSKNLVGCAQNFQITVVTDADFTTEKGLLYRKAMSLGVERVSADESFDWLDDVQNVDLVRNLRRKLSAVQSGLVEEMRSRREAEFVQNYLSSTRMQEQLRRFYPGAADAVALCKGAMEARIPVLALTANRDTAYLASVFSELTQLLHEHLHSFTPEVLAAIGAGILAEWMLECQLEFSGSGGTSGD